MNRIVISRCRAMTPMVRHGRPAVARNLGRPRAGRGHDRSPRQGTSGRTLGSWTLAAHFGLARALVATNGGLVRAIDEAEAARDGYREAGEGVAEELAAVEAWLAARPAR